MQFTNDEPTRIFHHYDNKINEKPSTKSQKLLPLLRRASLNISGLVRQKSFEEEIEFGDDCQVVDSIALKELQKETKQEFDLDSRENNKVNDKSNTTNLNNKIINDSMMKDRMDDQQANEQLNYQDNCKSICN